MGVVAGPQFLENGQHLLHEAPGVGLLQTGVHPVELALVGPRSDAELEAAAADQIQECRLAGQLDGVPVGSHGHCGAQPDPAGVTGPPRQDLQWVGSDGHLKGVVFSGPCSGKPSDLGHLDHLEGVAGHVVHGERIIESLQVDSQLELHDSFSESGSMGV